MDIIRESENYLQQISSNTKKESQAEEEKRVIEYVLENWIHRYADIKLTAEFEHVPKMTASYSDSPSQATGGFHSSTEDIALKRVSASNWIAIFNQSLEMIPPIHQQIITEKYLIRDGYGDYRKDYIVHELIPVNRTDYYKHKKKALYWLGLILLKEEKRRDKND